MTTMTQLAFPKIPYPGTYPDRQAGTHALRWPFGKSLPKSFKYNKASDILWRTPLLVCLRYICRVRGDSLLLVAESSVFGRSTQKSELGL